MVGDRGNWQKPIIKRLLSHHRHRSSGERDGNYEASPKEYAHPQRHGICYTNFRELVVLWNPVLDPHVRDPYS